MSGYPGRYPVEDVLHELRGRREAQRLIAAKERRERIATAVLAGFGAQHGQPWEVDPRSTARYAVNWADALIAELDK